MLIFYEIFLAVILCLCLPLLLMLAVLQRRNYFVERLGLCPSTKLFRNEKIIWIHAASVGEIKAVEKIVIVLRSKFPKAVIVVSTMTVAGKKVAQEQLDGVQFCFLAPLDLPLITDLAVSRISPDIYICVETEIWPVLLKKISSTGAKMYLLNGRMSHKSSLSYGKVKYLLKEVLACFAEIACITEADKSRYIAVGAAEDRIHVMGNLKYDFAAVSVQNKMSVDYIDILGVKSNNRIFVAGSTHENEEELLIPLCQKLSKQDFLCLIAPRHIERLSSLEKMFTGHNVKFDRFSDLKRGKERTHSIVLIDVLGELTDIYSISDFVFCGGSLVPRGGHNIMEVAVWQKPVFYGPNMDDFRDAVCLLESVHAGFEVNDVVDLASKIEYYINNYDLWEAAGLRAGDLVQQQRGAANRQIALVKNGK